MTEYGLPVEARVLSGELTALHLTVVAVLGNHDVESGKGEEIRQILNDAGPVLNAGTGKYVRMR